MATQTRCNPSYEEAQLLLSASLVGHYADAAQEDEEIAAAHRLATGAYFPGQKTWAGPFTPAAELAAVPQPTGASTTSFIASQAYGNSTPPQQQRSETPSMNAHLQLGSDGPTTVGVMVAVPATGLSALTASTNTSVTGMQRQPMTKPVKPVKPAKPVVPKKRKRGGEWANSRQGGAGAASSPPSNQPEHGQHGKSSCQSTTSARLHGSPRGCNLLAVSSDALKAPDGKMVSVASGRRVSAAHAAPYLGMDLMW